MDQLTGLKAILHSKRANIYYLEKCRVMVKNGRVVFLTETDSENQYWNIPIANTTVILLTTSPNPRRHYIVMNCCKNDWQDREYVLQWFGKKEGEARRADRVFVKEGIALGKRPELTGGGLIRSMGGWSVVKAMRKSRVKEGGDDRILGSGEFVSEVISQAEEAVKYQLPGEDLQKRVKDEIAADCRKEGISLAALRTCSRRDSLPKIRREISLKLINDYGVSLAETARQLGVSTSGVAQIVRRAREG